MYCNIIFAIDYCTAYAPHLLATEHIVQARRKSLCFALALSSAPTEAGAETPPGASSICESLIHRRLRMGHPHPQAHPPPLSSPPNYRTSSNPPNATAPSLSPCSDEVAGFLIPLPKCMAAVTAAFYHEYDHDHFRFHEYCDRRDYAAAPQVQMQTQALRPPLPASPRRRHTRRSWPWRGWCCRCLYEVEYIVLRDPRAISGHRRHLCALLQLVLPRLPNWVALSMRTRICLPGIRRRGCTTAERVWRLFTSLDDKAGRGIAAQEGDLRVGAGAVAVGVEEERGGGGGRRREGREKRAEREHTSVGV